MYAGFVYYLKRDDQRAIQYAQWATQLNPDFPEAWYTLAKVAAAARQPSIAVPSLERAIRAERSYALKARADGDFTNIENDVIALVRSLYDEAEYEAHRQWDELRKNLQIRWYQGQYDPMKIYELLQEETYFGYREALSCLEEFHTQLNQAGTDAVLTKRHVNTGSLGKIYQISWNTNGISLVLSGIDKKFALFAPKNTAIERRVIDWNISGGGTNIFEFTDFAYNPNKYAHIHAVYTAHDTESRDQNRPTFTYYLISSEKKVRVLHEANTLAEHEYNSYVFSPDGRLLALRESDGIFFVRYYLSVWNIETRAHV